MDRTVIAYKGKMMDNFASFILDGVNASISVQFPSYVPSNQAQERERDNDIAVVCYRIRDTFKKNGKYFLDVITTPIDGTHQGDNNYTFYLDVNGIKDKRLAFECITDYYYFMCNGIVYMRDVDDETNDVIFRECYTHKTDIDNYLEDWEDCSFELDFELSCEFERCPEPKGEWSHFSCCYNRL